MDVSVARKTLLLLLLLSSGIVCGYISYGGRAKDTLRFVRQQVANVGNFSWTYS